MRITLCDKDGNPVIQIRSMDTLNYGVFRKAKGKLKDGKLYNAKGDEIKSEWAFMNCYTQDLAHAISIGLEKFAMETEDEISVKVTRDIYSKLKKFIDGIIGKLTVAAREEDPDEGSD